MGTAICKLTSWRLLTAFLAASVRAPGHVPHRTGYSATPLTHLLLQVQGPGCWLAWSWCP